MEYPEPCLDKGAEMEASGVATGAERCAVMSCEVRPCYNTSGLGPHCDATPPLLPLGPPAAPSSCCRHDHELAYALCIRRCVYTPCDINKKCAIFWLGLDFFNKSEPRLGLKRFIKSFFGP